MPPKFYKGLSKILYHTNATAEICRWLSYLRSIAEGRVQNGSVLTILWCFEEDFETSLDNRFNSQEQSTKEIDREATINLKIYQWTYKRV